MTTSQNISATTASDPSCCAPTCCEPAATAKQPGSNQPGSNQPGSNQPGSNQPGSTSGLDDAQGIRDTVRDHYAKVARGSSGCCNPAETFNADGARKAASNIGYSEEQLDGLVEGANLGLGCGNPTAIAGLNPGEVVLDLGSGAGIDALLAAKQVGSDGRVIGVDMTPDMLERARKNAVDAGVARNVEFREGAIEELPVAAASVDAIISNCVINLSPDKPRVFAEAFRVLRPGGRIAVSDLLLTEALPPAIASHATAYVACIGGASLVEDYLGGLRDAGFVDIQTSRRPAATLIEMAMEIPVFREAVEQLSPELVEQAKKSVWSYDIEARKP